MEEEVLKIDASKCLSYFKYLTKTPLEIVLIQKFKMSFQIGVSSSVSLNKSLGHNLLNDQNATLSQILSVVSATRYYKCIDSINTILEQAILKKINNPDIAGVEFVKMENENSKLMVTFRILR